MPQIDVLKEEHLRICEKIEFKPKNCGLVHMSDNRMVLKHFPSGFIVTISREGVKQW